MWAGIVRIDVCWLTGEGIGARHSTQGGVGRRIEQKPRNKKRFSPRMVAPPQVYPLRFLSLFLISRFSAKTFFLSPFERLWQPPLKQYWHTVSWTYISYPFWRNFNFGFFYSLWFTTMLRAKDRDGIKKLPKITDADGFINQRRHIKDYLQQMEIDYLNLTDGPDFGSQRHQKEWLKENMKAISTIILTLLDGPFTHVRILSDNDANTAKKIYEELAKIYRVCITRIVIRVEKKIEPMTLEKDMKWKECVEKTD